MGYMNTPWAVEYDIVTTDAGAYPPTPEQAECIVVAVNQYAEKVKA